jgi:hypothetical protein
MKIFFTILQAENFIRSTGVPARQGGPPLDASWHGRLLAQMLSVTLWVFVCLSAARTMKEWPFHIFRPQHVSPVMVC